MPGKVFISYRRDDAAGYARLFFDRLSARFPGRVFMDVSGIEIGADFVETLDRAVGECQVLLALIGNEWLATTTDHGSRRLDKDHDFVRVEISTALRRRIVVIPVLLRGAKMPEPEELPPDLAGLSRRQAVEIRDTDFDHGMTRLIAAVERALGEAPPPPAPAPPQYPAGIIRKRRSGAWMWWMVGLGAIGFLVIGAIGLGGVLMYQAMAPAAVAPSFTPDRTPYVASEPAPAPTEIPYTLAGNTNAADDIKGGGGGVAGSWTLVGTNLYQSAPDFKMNLNLHQGGLLDASDDLGESATGTWSHDPSANTLNLLINYRGVPIILVMQIQEQSDHSMRAQTETHTYQFTRPAAY
jgi:hypothetical protein